MANTIPLCPKCKIPPTSTVESITGLASITWSEKGEIVHSGETTIDWESQHTVEEGESLLFHCGECHQEFFAAYEEDDDDEPPPPTLPSLT